MKTISKEDRTLSYRIQFKHNRHTYIRIKPGYLLVTTNMRTRIKDIESIIYKKFDSYVKRVETLSNNEKDDRISLWGKTYDFIVEKGDFTYEIGKGCVRAKNPFESIKEIKRAIFGEEMKRSLPHFEREIKHNLGSFHIDLLPVRIKYLKSKFGSYHRNKNEITLNSYLAQLDPIYTTYVLYHEYAHTVVFDHSKKFYQVLDRLMPEHRRYQKQLKNIVIHA